MHERRKLLGDVRGPGGLRKPLGGDVLKVGVMLGLNLRDDVEGRSVGEDDEQRDPHCVPVGDHAVPLARQDRREEHLLPLHVAVGASKNNEKISLLSSGWWGNLCMAHLSIGNE